MSHSDFCILKGLTPEVRYTMGECRHDLGGYFIIQGKEKTVVCQEKFADNMLYIRKYAEDGESEFLSLVKSEVFQRTRLNPFVLCQ